MNAPLLLSPYSSKDGTICLGTDACPPDICESLPNRHVPSFLVLGFSRDPLCKGSESPQAGPLTSAKLGNAGSFRVRYVQKGRAAKNRLSLVLLE